jgi:hypothetical protein
MSDRTFLSTVIPEKTTPVLTLTIVNQNDVGFKPDALTLMIYDYNSGTIIRAEGDILDANNGTVSTAGEVEYQCEPTDTVILNPLSGVETHVALFQWTFNAGLQFGKHEVYLKVRNFTKVS